MHLGFYLILVMVPTFSACSIYRESKKDEVELSESKPEPYAPIAEVLRSIGSYQVYSNLGGTDVLVANLTMDPVTGQIPVYILLEPNFNPETTPFSFYVVARRASGAESRSLTFTNGLPLPIDDNKKIEPNRYPIQDSVIVPMKPEFSGNTSEVIDEVDSRTPVENISDEDSIPDSDKLSSNVKNSPKIEQIPGSASNAENQAIMSADHNRSGMSPSKKKAGIDIPACGVIAEGKGTLSMVWMLLFILLPITISRLKLLFLAQGSQ